MNKLFFLLPAGYFIKTRLNTKAALLFHGYAEYLLGILLLLYAGMAPIAAIKGFFLGYLAFISMYEIGYIFNDFVSIRFEKNPRKRLAAWQPLTGTLLSWIAIRIATFLLLSRYLGVWSSPTWWGFYLILILSFTLHNVLPKAEYKICTFISLACLRFYAPIFWLLPTAFLNLSLPAILLCYVFFRTLTYIDSKGLLLLPGRSSLTFKTAFYIYLIPVSLLIGLVSQNLLSIWLNIYFLFFWMSLTTASKLGIIRLPDLKTE